MLAPEGVPNLYDDASPKNMLMTPIATLNRIAALNPPAIRIAYHKR